MPRKKFDRRRPQAQKSRQYNFEDPPGWDSDVPNENIVESLAVSTILRQLEGIFFECPDNIQLENLVNQRIREHMMSIQLVL